MNNVLVAPSILSADFANLERDIIKIEKAGADWIHIDVMDGHFVPNLTIGAPVVKALRKISPLTFDVHLMIEAPKKYIKDFAEAGADYITIHYEACENNLNDVIQLIKSFNIKVGISIKPNTAPIKIEPFIKDIDLILVMSVEPGFGGQSFIVDSLNKIKHFKDFILSNNLNNILIEVDGGINKETGKACIEAGANVLVAGSYIYAANDTKQAINSLKI